MQIENNSQYYLKRARASAKEIEFNVPDDLKSKKDVNIDELFPLAIACIADLSSSIIRQEIPIKQVRKYSKELYFASKFYDAYTYINEDEQKYFDDNNYFYLVGAIAYYLCDQVGSSNVLAQRICFTALNLSQRKLDVLLYHVLNNKAHIEDNSTTNPLDNDHISSFIRQYNQLMAEGADIDYKLINSFRKNIYDQNDFRDIFLIDALLAIFILKSEYSIFSMLPMYSHISKETLVDIVKSNHFIRELWPSQRQMCESGLFNGKSGVIQMPTGAGKTKALSIAIYSSFCSGKTSLSVVVAPFRALCREIYDDLKSDLCFDNNIKVNQISDLLQIDYVIEEFINPNKKTIIVTTPEKLLYILRQDESIVNNIEQLIFDEGHLFDDEERGANYELLISSIISKLNPNTQKILISAIIPNVNEINNWFTDNQGVAFSGNSIAIVDKLSAV
ncbi:MAG: DEAD/DEAH box helicase, partial [Ruminococcus sp.]|nr:DEAD/DEAH box helicase [Ruminococcus sp.]